MSHLDRYVFKQCLLVFAFFTLVFALVVWINRAVTLFDELVTDGHSAKVFLEFFILALPTVLSRVLPVSAFAATVYVTSRLSNESELAVIQATGMSPWRLARPVFMFGLLVCLLMFSLTAFLIPKTGTLTKDREFELSQSLGTKFLREGAFQHPVKGITFFIREITPDSELRDVFLSDRREKGASYTYTSERAFLLQTEKQIIFVMQNGLMQSHDRAKGTLSLTQFDELAYDLTGTFDTSRKARPHINDLPTVLLWQNPQLAADLTGQPLSRVFEDKHQRIQFALLCLISSLIGFAALYAAGFSRFGSGRFIALAIFLLVIVKLVEILVTEPTRTDIDFWYLVYAPSVVGLFMFWGLMYLSINSNALRKVNKLSERKL
jgi:lipopolysaccharide export system permease protein